MAQRSLLYGLLLVAFFIPATSPMADSPSPFTVGERLVYKVEWDPPWYMFFLPSMEAGEVEVLLAETTRHKNRKALKIIFKARSSGRLMRMAGMKIDDEFVLLTDPDTFCTMTVSEKIREGKRKRQVDVEYMPETRQLHIREVDEAPNPPILRRDETKDNIPACVHDPLSAVYLFRKMHLDINHSEIFVIANDDKIQEVQVTVEKKENVNVPLGKMTAWKTNTTALKGGLFRAKGDFKLWLSADHRRLPVQFEAKVNLGRVVGKIKSVQ